MVRKTRTVVRKAEAPTEPTKGRKMKISKEALRDLTAPDRTTGAVKGGFKKSYWDQCY